MRKKINYLKLNLKFLIGTCLSIAGAMFSVMSLVLTFFSWEDLGITSKQCRFKIIGMIIIAAMICAIVRLILSREKIIWEQGTGRISVIYGDIIKKAFPRLNKKKDERIIVIPVNTCFDTIIGNGLVSPKTIHGAWVQHMNIHGCDTDSLNEKIKQALSSQGIHCNKVLSKITKPIGNRNEYPQGSIAVLDEKSGVVFYLLALSEFDKNLNAQCAKDEFVQCIQNLITFYNQHGQGAPLYIPLMGTGLSRAGLSHEESLNVISNLLKLNGDQIHGEVNIVVFEKDMDKVSIHNL